LAEEFNRIMGELSTHKYQFDRQEREIELLKELTLEDFQNHFASLLEPKQSARLDMHWNSAHHKEQEELAKHLLENYTHAVPIKEKQHKTVSSLKNSMGLYPDTFKSNFAKGVNKQN
jgi:secreted Zn-dependent insulinase-like peptidase